ncbi:MAG: hypothetical protein KC473_03495 [Candidatus Dadabacteria bacterium]|nr:hypothetical protein [Candidatus Dadabacteria bacterium]
MQGLSNQEFMYFIVAFLIVAAIIPILRRLAFTTGFVDMPEGRKRHDNAVPPVGGLAIFPVFMALLYYSGMLPVSPWVYVGLTVLLVVGVLDDVRALPASFKFIVQIVVAFLIVVPGGIRVNDLGDLLGFGPIWLSWVSIPFTIIAVVLVVNAINLIDGLDGLAGGFGFIITFWLAVCCYLSGQLDRFIAVLILAGALLGFLVYNMRHPFRQRATAFLGNSGSQCLGLVLAWLLIEFSQMGRGGAVIQPITVAWLLALPIYDTCGQFARRVSLGRHPFDPDRHHFHHHFLYAGLTDAQATTAILLVVFVTGLIGVGGMLLGVPEGVLTYLWIVFLLLHIYMSMRPLRYLEILLPLNGKSVDNVIGQLILESGVINEAQLLEVLEHQGKFGGKIGELLVEKGYISKPRLEYFLNLQVVRNATRRKINRSRRDMLLGEIMLADNVITNDQLEEALSCQRQNGGWIGQILIGLGYVTESGLKKCLDRQSSVRTGG